MIDAALVLSIGGSIHSCIKASAIYYKIFGFKGEYSQLQTSNYSSIYFYEREYLDRACYYPKNWIPFNAKYNELNEVDA